MTSEFVEILTPAQAAERLQLSTEAVMRLLRAGELGGRRVGKFWRTTSTALDVFMQQGQPTRPAAQRETRQSRPAPRPVSEPVTLAARMLGKR